MSFKHFVLRSTFYSGLSIYVESFIGLLISILIARQLGPEELGIYSLFMWLSLFGVVIANAGLTVSSIKFLAEARSKDELGVSKGILAYLYRLQLIFLPIALGLSLLLAYWLSENMVDDSYLLLLFSVVLAIAPKALQIFYISTAKGYEAFKTIFYINATVTPLNLILVLIVIALDGKIEHFVWSYLAISMLYYLISRFWVQKRVNEDIDTQDSIPDDYKGRINGFIKISGLTALFAFVLQREIEIVFLNWFSTPSDAAFYSVSYRLSEAVKILVMGGFNTVFLPLMTRSLVSGKDVLLHRYRESGRIITLVCAPIFSFGVIFSQQIIDILYGDQYAPAAFPLMLFFLASSITFVNTLAVSILLSTERQKHDLQVVAICSVITIVLDFILISNFALYGAVAANIFTALISFVLYQMFVYRIFKTGLPLLEYIKIYLIAYAALIPVYGFYSLFEHFFAFIFSGIVFLILYTYLVILFSKVTQDELDMFTSYLKEWLVLKNLFRAWK